MKNTLPDVQADAESAKDPNKADWFLPALESEVDETAGVFLAESETLAIAYQLMSMSYKRDGVKVNEDWLIGTSQSIGKRLNLYLQLDRETAIFDCHPLGRLVFMNILNDLQDGLSNSEFFWEDVIGFTVIPLTSVVKLHFSLEGLENGGITAQHSS